MPDEREISWRSESMPLSVGELIFVAIITLIFLVGLVVIVVTEIRFNKDYGSFMAACIEFKSAERCKELHMYKRRDLAFK